MGPGSPEGYTHSGSLLNLSVLPQPGLTGPGIKGGSRGDNHLPPLLPGGLTLYSAGLQVLAPEEEALPLGDVTMTLSCPPSHLAVPVALNQQAKM